jgi:hypothetical protein
MKIQVEPQVIDGRVIFDMFMLTVRALIVGTAASVVVTVVIVALVTISA